MTFTRLVHEGIEESGLGDPVGKMGKRMKIPASVLRDALRQPSVGIIETDEAKSLVKYGKPVGLIGLHRALQPRPDPVATRSTRSRPATW